MSLEYVIQAQCQTMIIDGRQRSGPDLTGDMLMMSCSKAVLKAEDGEGTFEDCVNGVWMGANFNGGETNYSVLTNTYRDKIANRAVSTLLNPNVLIS